ncbi:inner centromere protein A-like [Wyeomyia smithii]|uniref:inner centromere protein A-like n=1 Tax=Wyeomyia smithii TaxID=174621 RepID=UPI002467B6F0|nr:inner centromere protein A-like [Wyeomyia smithii]
MSDEYYDEDGFRLTFEDDTSEQEKQFFMRAFPNVNRISERKVHCTSCYMHIGTAPISEAVIRMHPILRVTHCRNCHTFYNSGEFDKGEDGSELYCRWCGQGGEVYCCSKCPYVFCKKCIVQNLSRACVQDISRNDNWQCFSCAPKIMWHLRAQHWALVNYIEKQKKDMKDKNHTVSSINSLMKLDNTTCCNNKGLNKKTSTPTSSKKAVKRVSDAHEAGAAKIPEKRTIMQVQQQQPTIQPPAAKKAKTDNNEVVCTPDIMSMFMNPEESSQAAGNVVIQKPTAPAPTSAPAPVPISNRPVVVRPAFPGAQNPMPMRMPMANASNLAPPPVYHTINGYKIDLHTAAQQGTYRLPNGKLIQVRKQAPAVVAPQPPVGNRNITIAPKPTPTYYNPSNVMPIANARVANGNPNVHINIALQQQQQLQEQRLQQQRQQQQQQQQLQQQQMLHQARPQLMVPVGQPQPTIVAGQPNPALQLPTLVMLQSMVNGPHEDSPLGRSRKNFEGKLLSGVEICQHIVSKINTLTNSNPFKNIRNVRDLKELYIHVSYLLTYAIGRFKTLQEKCVDDVKKMGFTKESDFVMMGEQISNRNPDEDKSDDEGDCEIVEQNTTLITIDSEDEEDSSKKQKQRPVDKQPTATETEVAVAAILEDRNDADSSVDPISIDEFLHVSLSESDKTLDPSSSTVSVVSESSDKVDKGAANTEPNSSSENKNDNDDDDDLVEIIEPTNEATSPEKLADENIPAVTTTAEPTTVENIADEAEPTKPQDVVEKLDVDDKTEETSENTVKAADGGGDDNTAVEAGKEVAEKTGDLEKMEVEPSGEAETSKSGKDVVESTNEIIESEQQTVEKEIPDGSKEATDETAEKQDSVSEKEQENTVDDEKQMETEYVDLDKQSTDKEAKENVAKPSETNDPIELDDDEDDDVAVVETVEESKTHTSENSSTNLANVDDDKLVEASSSVELSTQANNLENPDPAAEAVTVSTDNLDNSASIIEDADSTVPVNESSKTDDDVTQIPDSHSDTDVASVGVTVGTDDSENPASIVEDADSAVPVEAVTVSSDNLENSASVIEDVSSTIPVTESSKTDDDVARFADSHSDTEVAKPSEVVEQVSVSLDDDEVPTVVQKEAESSEPNNVEEILQGSESNIETAGELQEPQKSEGELDNLSNANIFDGSQNEAAVVDTSAVPAISVVSEISAVPEVIPEELEVPTGNDLLASIEDSFQKLQQLFDATENDAAEEQLTTNDEDVDMQLAEPAVEQMDVDENLLTTDVESNIFEVAQETLSKNLEVATNGTNLLGSEDGLEPIVSEENFTNSQDSSNSPQNAMAPEVIDKLEEIQNITSLDELTVNGDC